MDINEAFGGKFTATEGKRKDRTRIKNLEPEPRSEPVTQGPQSPRAPQGTNLRPSDVNPRPSSVHQGPIPNFPTLGQVLGNAAKTTLGTIGSLGSSLGHGGLTSEPGIYLIQLSIARDDCHMICMFLFVFILSFLLSNKKLA